MTVHKKSSGKGGSGADKNFYLTDLDDVYKALEFIKKHINGGKENCNVSDAIKCLYETYRNTSRAVHAFCIVQPEGALHEQGDADILGKIKKETKVKINTVFSEKFIDKDTDNGSDTSSFTYAKNISFITGGKSYFIYDDSSEFMLKQIYNNPEVENGYKAIIGTGYRTVVFNSSLEQNYKWFNGKEKDKITEDDDLDKDGLYDYQEIMFKDSKENLLVKENSDGSIQLLKYEEIIKKMGEELFYVKNGLDRYCSATGENANNSPKIESLLKCNILPIKSDPTKKDTDYDDLPDICEYYMESNMFHIDTDKDGIPDFAEYYFNTSPLKTDTNGNGIDDSNEDYDEDGIINIEEFLSNTYEFKSSEIISSAVGVPDIVFESIFLTGLYKKKYASLNLTTNNQFSNHYYSIKTEKDFFNQKIIYQSDYYVNWISRDYLQKQMESYDIPLWLKGEIDAFSEVISEINGTTTALDNINIITWFLGNTNVFDELFQLDNYYYLYELSKLSDDETLPYVYQMDINIIGKQGNINHLRSYYI